VESNLTKSTFSIIYNVTVHIDKDFAEIWLQWLMKEHIPEVMATRCFTHYHVLRILDTDETDGLTYAIQYFASMGQYQIYINEYAEGLRQKSNERWGDAFTSFRTLLEVVQ